MLPVWLAQAIETEEERSKMEQLYDEYERLLYSIAFRYMHDSYRAEDAVHDTFVKIIDHLDSINEIKINRNDGSGLADYLLSEVKCPQTRAFLVTIVGNICLNMLTRKSYTAEVYGSDEDDRLIVETLPDPYSNTADMYSNKYEVSLVTDAIRQLPEILQDTMILYAAHGYTTKEIAEIQGCSTETIKKRIQRGREKIRKMLGEDK